MRSAPYLFGSRFLDTAIRNESPDTVTAAAFAASAAAPISSNKPNTTNAEKTQPMMGYGLQRQSLLRIGLAFSLLLLAHQEQGLLFMLLVGYIVHCIAIHSLLYCRLGRQYLFRLGHWLDASWGVAFIVATGSNEHLFYFFLIYPVTIAGLLVGMRESWALVIATVIGLLLGCAERYLITQQWSTLATQIIGLLAFGYLGAVWAGFEGLYRRRLQLLCTLNHLPNPRFGSKRLLNTTLTQLRNFYRADCCIAVLTSGGTTRMHWSGDREPSLAAENLHIQLAHSSVLVQAPSIWQRYLRPNAPQAPRVRLNGKCPEHEIAASLISEFEKILGPGSWISVPLHRAGAVCGRLYVLSRYQRYDDPELWLLREASDQFMPLLECVELLYQLSINAAEKEREKISLDLHDSAIQPYLGLKLGLEALRRKIPADDHLADDVNELCRMTVDSIAELRGYVGGLGGVSRPAAARQSNHAQKLSEQINSDGRSRQQIATLQEDLHIQMERFRSFYGIETNLKLKPDLPIDDFLAGELIQMVGEGLSNVGRHTQSRRVDIEITGDADALIVEIINQGTGTNTLWQSFVPQSLTRRAQHLGGYVDVSQQPCGGSAVRVTIPL